MERAVLAAVDRRMGALGRVGVMGAGVLAVAVLGLIDLVSGSEISFSIFYVVPISAAAWYAGLPVASAVSVVSAGAWLVADGYGGATYSGPLIPYWNTLVRLGYFLLIARLIAALRDRLDYEEELADTDGLTGLRNGRAFREALESERVRAQRYGRPFTLAYLDLDDFKRVNDTEGHGVGDRVIQEAAAALRQAMRRTDVLGRLGGDEFAALLPETDARAAGPVLEKLRDQVGAAMARGGWGVGASVGAVTFQEAPGSSALALRAADELLYDAKRTGKNRVVHRVHAGAPPPGGRG